MTRTVNGTGHLSTAKAEYMFEEESLFHAAMLAEQTDALAETGNLDAAREDELEARFAAAAAAQFSGSDDLGMYNDVPNFQANDPVYEVDAVFMDTHYKMP